METTGPQRGGQQRPWAPGQVWGGRGVSHSHMTYLLAQVPTLETASREERPSVFQTVCSGAAGTGAGVTGEVGHRAGFA